MVTEVLIGRHPEIWIMSGDRPDVRGDRRVCAVFSASGFVQTQNGLVWMNAISTLSLEDNEHSK